jgi:hypothetical protein
VHQAFLEISLVPGLVRPDHDSLALHIVIMELALINFSCVLEVVPAIPFELSIHEVTLVKPSIELKFTLPSFLSLAEIARVLNLLVIP